MQNDDIQTFSEILGQIASNNYQSDLSVISGDNQFFRALQKHEICKQAVRIASESNVALKMLTEAIDSVTCEPADRRYLHPKDIEIATLLYILGHTYSSNVLTVAERIAVIPRTWYARKMAFAIIDSMGDRMHSNKLCIHAHTGVKVKCMDNKCPGWQNMPQREFMY